MGGLLALVVVAGAVAGAVVGVTGGGKVSVVVNSVAVIDPALNKVVADVPAGVRPVALAVGHRPRAVWIADAGSRTVIRIDPTARTSSPPIGLEAEPNEIAVGAGAVWVANEDGTVSRIDGRANTVVATISVGAQARAITAGADGVWVASGNGELIRIDPGTNRVVRRVHVRFPLSLTEGYGAVFVGTGRGAIFRIDARTGAVERARPGPMPTSLATGGGALWLADSVRGYVFKLDPSSLRVTGAVRVGGLPTHVAVGGRSVWIAIAGSPVRVLRLDRRSERIEATIGVRPVPSDLGLLQSRLWVLVVQPARD